MIVLATVSTVLFLYGILLCAHPDAEPLELAAERKGGAPDPAAKPPQNISAFQSVLVGDDLETLLLAALVARTGECGRRVLLLCQSDEAELRRKVATELQLGLSAPAPCLRAALPRATWVPLTPANRVVEAVGVDGEVVHAVERGRRKWIGSLLASFPAHRAKLLRATRNMRTACGLEQRARSARALLGERAVDAALQAIGAWYAPALWVRSEASPSELLRAVGDELPSWAYDCLTGGERERALVAAASMPERVQGRLTTSYDVVDGALAIIAAMGADVPRRRRGELRRARGAAPAPRPDAGGRRREDAVDASCLG